MGIKATGILPDYDIDEKTEATQWAIRLLARPNWVVLAIAATGTTDEDQVCQIAVVDVAGQVLLDTLVKPTCPITVDSSTLRPITEKTVKDAPGWRKVFDQLKSLIGSKTVLSYSRRFDGRLMEQTFRAAEIYSGRLWWANSVYQEKDPMDMYAQWLGIYSDKRGIYRWAKLPNTDGSALSACQATLAIIKQMAGNSMVTNR